MRAPRVTAALVALAMLGGGVFATSAQARTDNRAKDVWFVHGLDWVGESGVDCAATFAEMKRRFREWGFTGAWGTTGYYHGDTNCSRLDGHGYHTVHWGDLRDHKNGSHTSWTSIRHLAYHFAWQLWNNAGRYNETVDIVTHSMGGLIARYALTLTEEGHPEFPPYLFVEDVVTLGTPHGGARWAAWGCVVTQCEEMRAGSRLLQDLENGFGWHPDTWVATDWSTYGSDDDDAVAADRAAATADDRSPIHDYMGSCHKTWYMESSNIEHDEFRTASSSADSADVYRYDCNNGGGWAKDYYSQWPVRRAARALTWGTE